MMSGNFRPFGSVSLEPMWFVGTQLSISVSVPSNMHVLESTHFCVARFIKRDRISGSCPSTFSLSIASHSWTHWQSVHRWHVTLCICAQMTHTHTEAGDKTKMLTQYKHSPIPLICIGKGKRYNTHCHGLTYTCTPCVSSASGMSHICLCLPMPELAGTQLPTRKGWKAE